MHTSGILYTTFILHLALKDNLYKPLITKNTKMILNPKLEKSSADELKVTFKEMDSGFFNLLKKELWSHKETKMAGFRVTHPQVGETEFFLKTKGKNAKKVWNDSIASLAKKFSEIK